MYSYICNTADNLSINCNYTHKGYKVLCFFIIPNYLNVISKANYYNSTFLLEADCMLYKYVIRTINIPVITP